MALTFLDTVLEQQPFSSDDDFPVTAGTLALRSSGTAAHEACLHNRDEFYAEIIRSLNECMAEGGCGEDVAAAKSLVEDETLAHREWKRLLDRVLSGPIEA